MHFFDSASVVSENIRTVFRKRLLAASRRPDFYRVAKVLAMTVDYSPKNDYLCTPKQKITITDL